VRTQTLNREQDPVLHDVLSAFAEATGVPFLCAAPLCDAGEPMVDTAGQAIDFCLRNKVRVAYLNGRRVAPTGEGASEGPAPRTTEPFDRDETRVAELAGELNPTGLDARYLHVWLRYPLLRRRFDLTDPRGAQTLKRTVDSWLAANSELATLFDRWVDQSHNPRTRTSP
jgi:hypothetical protein